MKIQIVKAKINPIYNENSYLVKVVNEILKDKKLSWQSLSLLNKRQVLSKIILKCKMCPMFKEARLPVVPHMVEEPQAIFIARNPGRQEDEEGIVLNPKAPGGKLFKAFLGCLGIEREETYLTNVCLCHTKGDRPLTFPEMEICMGWKYFEFSAIKVPEIIFLMGNDALRAIMGINFLSITKIHGMIYKIENMGLIHYVVPIYHPGYLLRGERSRYEEVAQILKFVRDKLLNQ